MVLRASLVLAFVLAVACGAMGCGGHGGGGSGGTAAVAAPAPAPDHMSYALGLINTARAQHGAGPLALDSGLNTVAMRHAQDLAALSASVGFAAAAHHDFNAGDTGGATAECQGVASGGDQDADFKVTFDLMMAEGPPPAGQINHYSILMDPNETLIGIGLFFDSSQTLWVSEEFK
ncbi:CAP domain-containing protein [bacterium]|nr:CAP domain-containing protein [bacterium]